jgi:hypothetical protein
LSAAPLALSRPAEEPNQRDATAALAAEAAARVAVMEENLPNEETAIR